MALNKHYSYEEYAELNPKAQCETYEEYDEWWIDEDTEEPELLSEYFSKGLDDALKTSEWLQTNLLDEISKFLSFYQKQNLPRPSIYTWQNKECWN